MNNLLDGIRSKITNIIVEEDRVMINEREVRMEKGDWMDWGSKAYNKINKNVMVRRA